MHSTKVKVQSAMSKGSEYKGQESGCIAQEYRLQCSGYRVQGSEYSVSCPGYRVQHGVRIKSPRGQSTECKG